MKLFKIIAGILYVIFCLAGNIGLFLLYDSSWSGILSLAISGTLWTVLMTMFINKLQKNFERRWTHQYDRGYVKGWYASFDQIDKEFPSIMTQSLPIVNEKGEKIGNQTVYGAMKEKLDKKIKE